MAVIGLLAYAVKFKEGRIHSTAMFQVTQAVIEYCEGVIMEIFIFRINIFQKMLNEVLW